MQKEKRTDSKATLEVVGRDQPDQRLYLSKDQESLVWGLDHAENELWKQPPDPVLEAVAKIVSADNREWEGSPTELAQAIQTDMAVNRLTKHLNVNADLTWGLNDIFQKDFQTITFAMYPIYLNVGFGYAF